MGGKTTWEGRQIGITSPFWECRICCTSRDGEEVVLASGRPTPPVLGTTTSDVASGTSSGSWKMSHSLNTRGLEVPKKSLSEA